MEIKIFKVGEDFIIGQQGDQAGAGNVRIMNPLLVVMTEQGPRLIDIFTFLTDDGELVVNESKISFTVNPVMEIKEVYEKSLNKSPIIEMSKKLVY